MPKSLVEFIEGVSDGSINITQQDLVDLINNANTGPGPKKTKARDLQSALLDQFDVDVLLRDCQLMISLRDNVKLEMATAPGGPRATMKY